MPAAPFDDTRPTDTRRVLGARAAGSRGPVQLAGTVVVVPSLSFPPAELAKITAIERYEERLLYLLLGLARPDLRLVYVTSLPVDPAVLDYYLGFLADPDSARHRLRLVTLGRSRGVGLAAELVGDEAALGRVRAALRDLGGPADAYLLPFNVSPAEVRLGARLGLPLYAAPAELVALGSKTGSRRAGRAAGVPVLPGREDLRSMAAVTAALAELRAVTDMAVVKLNNGFSGQGNAVVRLDGSGLTDGSTTFCAAGESWPSLAAKIEAEGAVAEQLLAAGCASPSGQAWIEPDGSFRVVSTHDQLLGGPEGQVYLGCRFPAADAHRGEVTAATARVADHLARAGVVGPFGVDFVIPPGGPAYLSEINLRLGGTTHPFGMAALACGARYDDATGALLADDARPRCYLATDNLRSTALVGRPPAEVITRVADAGLAFDRGTGSGVTLHLLGAVPEHGKVGVVCVGDSPTAAADLYAAVLALLTG